MDSESARQKLLERIGDINDFTRPRPLVTLEEFFEGNDDYASIGYNFYPDQPAPAEFYEVFLAIRQRDDVADVRVEVKDLEDPEGWPATDTVWIITTASDDEVVAWLGERFAPDDAFSGFPQADPHAEYPTYGVEAYEVPAGQRALGIWWD